MRRAQQVVNRVIGRRIDPELGTSLATRLGAAAARADEVRSGLGC